MIGTINVVLENETNGHLLTPIGKSQMFQSSLLKEALKISIIKIYNKKAGLFSLVIL